MKRKLKGKPIGGIQIHPEIEVSSAKKFLKNLINQDLKNKFLFGKALESNPKDSKIIYPVVRAFLKLRRKL